MSDSGDTKKFLSGVQLRSCHWLQGRVGALISLVAPFTRAQQTHGIRSAIRALGLALATLEGQDFDVAESPIGEGRSRVEDGRNGQDESCGGEGNRKHFDNKPESRPVWAAKKSLPLGRQLGDCNKKDWAPRALPALGFLSATGKAAKRDNAALRLPRSTRGWVVAGPCT